MAIYAALLILELWISWLNFAVLIDTVRKEKKKAAKELERLKEQMKNRHKRQKTPVAIQVQEQAQLIQHSKKGE